MKCDIILFFENLRIQDLSLFHMTTTHEKIVCFRYLLFCDQIQFEIFEEYFKDNPHIQLFCIYSMEPFEYSAFNLFLKSNLKQSTDFYIITNFVSPTYLTKIINHHIVSNSIYKIKSIEKLTYVLNSDFFEILSFPSPIKLFMEDCFLWNIMQLNNFES